MVNTTNSGSNRSVSNEAIAAANALIMRMSMHNHIGKAKDLMHICQDYSYLGACNISVKVKNLEGESTTKCSYV